MSVFEFCHMRNLDEKSKSYNLQKVSGHYVHLLILHHRLRGLVKQNIDLMAGILLRSLLLFYSVAIFLQMQFKSVINKSLSYPTRLTSHNSSLNKSVYKAYQHIEQIWTYFSTLLWDQDQLKNFCVTAWHYLQVLTRIDKMYRQPPPVTRNVTAFMTGRSDLFPTGTITLKPCWGVFWKQEKRQKISSCLLKFWKFLLVVKEKRKSGDVLERTVLNCSWNHAQDEPVQPAHGAAK